jgi:hypothetical protein
MQITEGLLALTSYTSKRELLLAVSVTTLLRHLYRSGSSPGWSQIYCAFCGASVSPSTCVYLIEVGSALNLLYRT